MNFHILSSYNSKNNIDGYELSNRCEGVKVINTRDLREFLDHQMSLVVRAENIRLDFFYFFFIFFSFSFLLLLFKS